jgi:hypothetical protein
VKEDCLSGLVRFAERLPRHALSEYVSPFGTEWSHQDHEKVELPVLSGLMPFSYRQRFAREAQGDNSKATHRACAKRALPKIPSLEEYEHRALARA